MHTSEAKCLRRKKCCKKKCQWHKVLYSVLFQHFLASVNTDTEDERMMDDDG